MLPRVNPNLFILLSLPKIISQKYLQLLAHHHRFPIQTLLDFEIESPHILSSQPQPLFISSTTSSIRIILHLFLPHSSLTPIIKTLLALPSEEDKQTKKALSFSQRNCAKRKRQSDQSPTPSPFP